MQNGHISQTVEENEGGVNIAEYLDILIDSRWLIAAITMLFLAFAGAYVALSQPIYESNLSVQVEDSGNSAGSFLGDAASSLLSVKTPSSGEIEIIRSRAVLGNAVENTKLYIDARPRYFPIIGGWLSRRSKGISTPGFLGFDGYVTGREKINVAQFDVPQAYEGVDFLVRALGEEEYEISFPDPSAGKFVGKVGTPLNFRTAEGNAMILIAGIDGLANAEFKVTRNSKLLTLLALQDSLKVAEKGKQSGVLDVSWQSADPLKLTQLLNEVGRLYIRQNIDRKAAEAEKTLVFLNSALPQFKKQLEESEDTYNKFRNQNGTVSLDDEAKNALTQTVDLQSKLLDAQQRRRELSARFTDKNPVLVTLDAQILAWKSEISEVDARIRKMPMLQQSTFGMQRDIKVNTDLYVSLLNSSLQMRLAKEGKVGNVRLLDDAVEPERPIRPQKSLIFSLMLLVGVLVGGASAIASSLFFGGVKNPSEIEAHTGLNVYSTIPLSEAQKKLDRNMEAKSGGGQLLAVANAEDPAIESLRSLRIALQFSMLDAVNNRLLISGATPSVGKTFLSANFAVIASGAGRRVLLIDADLRKGRINQFVGMRRARGLSELIVGSINLQDAIHAAVLPNLDVMTTGILPPNPAELLMSSSFSRILDEVSPLYDMVIIDTAPVLVAADTASVAPLVGTVLLVARADKTHLGELNESVRRLAHTGSAVNGVVLNGLDLAKRHFGSSGYRYGGYRYTNYKYQANENS